MMLFQNICLLSVFYTHLVIVAGLTISHLNCLHEFMEDETASYLRIKEGELIEAEWHIYALVYMQSFAQIMAWRLVGTKPLSETMLECC